MIKLYLRLCVLLDSVCDTVREYLIDRSERKRILYYVWRSVVLANKQGEMEVSIVPIHSPLATSVDAVISAINSDWRFRDMKIAVYGVKIVVSWE